MEDNYGIITLACLEAGYGVESEIMQCMLSFREKYLRKSVVGLNLVKAYEESLMHIKDLLSKSCERHNLLMNVFAKIKIMKTLIEENRQNEAVGIYISTILQLEFDLQNNN